MRLPSLKVLSPMLAVACAAAAEVLKKEPPHKPFERYLEDINTPIPSSACKDWVNLMNLSWSRCRDGSATTIFGTEEHIRCLEWQVVTAQAARKCLEEESNQQGLSR